MAEAIRWVKTHCARMDHGGCGLLVGIEGNTIVQVKGDPEGYLNRGYTCFKGRVSADRLTHPEPPPVSSETRRQARRRQMAAPFLGRCPR